MAGLLLTIIPSALTALITVVIIWALTRFRPAPPEGTPDWLVAIAAYITAQGRVRVSLNIIITAILPAAILLLSLGETWGLTKSQIVDIAIICTGLAFLISLLLLIGDKSPGQLAGLLGRAELLMQDERNRSIALQRHLAEQENALTEEISQTRALAFYRERLGFRINQVLAARRIFSKPLNVANSLSFLLSEAVESGDELFGWVKSEKWTIAFYLWSEADDALICSCSCRPSGTDFGEGHRAWRSGEGMVGITFQRGRRLIVADAEKSELEIVMSDQDETVAAKDRQRYRSVVALPIFRPIALADEGVVAAGQPAAAPHSRLYGVVIATSDEPERFDPEEAELGLGTLAALSQAASSVLIAAELRTA